MRAVNGALESRGHGPGKGLIRCQKNGARRLIMLGLGGLGVIVWYGVNNPVMLGVGLEITVGWLHPDCATRHNRTPKLNNLRLILRSIGENYTQ